MELTPEMVRAGVEWFEHNNDGRYPIGWGLTEDFVTGLVQAVLDARERRRDTVEARGKYPAGRTARRPAAAASWY